MQESQLKSKFNDDLTCRNLRAYRGSFCIRHKCRNDRDRAALLKKIRMISAGLGHPAPFYIDPQCGDPFAAARPDKTCEGSVARPAKVLLFRNIYNSAGKELNRWFSPGALYLASGLKKAGFKTLLCGSKISLDDRDFIADKDELEKILKDNPDLNFVGISICEDFFDQARELILFIRRRSRAFIGVGGVMPTLTPAEVFVHLPELNFLVRGAGEEVFPRLVDILDGKNVDSPISYDQLVRLAGLKGLIFKNERVFISASLNEINEVDDFDDSRLDLSFLDRAGLDEGLNLFVSRGCFNNCFFCTSFGRGEYNGKSFFNLKTILRDYRRRLKEIFGDNIPHSAFRLSFNDDDFLADCGRARSFFAFLKKQPFLINFLQTGINSFFTRSRFRSTDKLNRRLLKSIVPFLFCPGKTGVYIGTENFCDAELKRLGKGYDYKKAEKVALALSAKKIRQAHHFIVSNHFSRPQDILENLFKIAQLQAMCGEYFNILVPVIPYLVSFYPSASYKIAARSGRAAFSLSRKLSVAGYPEQDYPLVRHDVPLDGLTREIVPEVSRLFLSERDYSQVLDMVLVKLRMLQIKRPSLAARIAPLIAKYKDHPELIYRKTGKKPGNDRNNLQLMVTRRCQLRCRYCPIIKKDRDMEETVLYRSIDLLLTCSRSNVRLDFTGGEPLLRFDLVEKGVRYAKEAARRKNKNISFYLVTNLLALDDKIADFLARERFFLELSMDGTEEFHNRCKLALERGLNPYRRSVSGLRKIFTCGIENYAVMVVSPLTVDNLYSNLCHILEIGFRNVGINYALGSLWRRPQRQEFFRQLDTVREKLYPFISKGMIKLSNLGSRTEPAILNSEIMVDVDGSVRFLNDLLFESGGGSDIKPLGIIDDFNRLNSIPLTKFMALDRILKGYHRSDVAPAVVNNIEMGTMAKDYFERWKKEFRL